MPSPNRAVGLVGIGLVGTALAERLLRAGYAVVGYDIDACRRSALVELGGEVVEAPRDVAERTSRVVLSLFDGDAVRLVVEGVDGLVSAAQPPSHIIDTTTGSPDETRRLAGSLDTRGIRLIDATISGSSAQLREDRAVLMVGGEEDAVAAC
ncbi:NAD(P)-dependent oxidoreductase, partial [Candidatus Poribacteria bacterium]|nr:NAD(P)-dependent oxidoreductase [Candidatus Poribacteria bacterium]